jgi:hypothetical protein
MRFYRVLEMYFVSGVIKVSEIIIRSFDGLKRGIEKAWEKVKEYYFLVWIGLGLIFMYPLIVKIFGG